ncbi:MAG TPA: CocE/NonD family hydrolase [Kofleriaceae bacterium]|jgi:hypothetical protein
MRTLVLIAALAATASAAPTPPMMPDVPDKLVEKGPTGYDKRELMIPMRDGVKLYTVVLVPKGAKHAPIMLTRTPYNAAKRAQREPSNELAATLPMGDDQFVAAGYIRVFQDVRGKYGSEGDYVMTRPLRGPLNATAVDHSTDTYDTIEYLIHHIPETNGRVGMIGSSYEGFTVLMALVHPHPALKVAVPECPMVDGWRGDDWFHNGAFRQVNFSYFFGQTSAHGAGKDFFRSGADDYETFRRAGSAGDYAKATGIDVLPYWKKLSEHAAYDAYWQQQALDKILAAQPLTVPTMIVTGQWDQEDMYGATAVYAALEPKDHGNNKLYLVLGPWRHSGQSYSASSYGAIDFGFDTALAWRRDVLRPFLDQYLVDGAPKASTPPVFVFETGTDQWRRAPRWPLAAATRALYPQPGGKLAWAPAAPNGFDEYVSDPAKPVPFQPRPIDFDNHDQWKDWLGMDQRAVEDRTDVLVYETGPLTAPVHVAGAPQVDLVASTSGTDSDWVVKLVDVYPDEYPVKPALGGYELPIGMDIFRGRYRLGFDAPSAIPANTQQHYKFGLPNVDHVFLPGHRIIVQVQSSWFPLYDRNPQTFVDNIFFAPAAAYVKATQRVYHATKIDLPTL